MSSSLAINTSLSFSSSKKSSENEKDLEFSDFISIDSNTNLPDILAFPIYRISKLGQGSSSVVYKSILLNRLQICAEKVFIVSDQTKKQYLIRELNSLKSLVNNTKVEYKFSHIIHLNDIYLNPIDGTISLCLEYMNGSLQDVVNLGGFKNEEFLSSVAYQMTLGLSHLHSLRILHRDLKPSNVLLSNKGIVKLTDFGLAKKMEIEQSLADSFVGTFDYMAPERLSGQQYSFSSDIWSLGITILTVSEGSYPLDAFNATMDRNKKKHGFWELLHYVQESNEIVYPKSTYTQDFNNFILCACAKDPKNRYSADRLRIHSFLKDASESIPNYLIEFKNGAFQIRNYVIQKQNKFESSPFKPQSAPSNSIKTNEKMAHPNSKYQSKKTPHASTYQKISSSKDKSKTQPEALGTKNKLYKQTHSVPNLNAGSDRLKKNEKKCSQTENQIKEKNIKKPKKGEITNRNRSDEKRENKMNIQTDNIVHKDNVKGSQIRPTDNELENGLINSLVHNWKEFMKHYWDIFQDNERLEKYTEINKAKLESAILDSFSKNLNLNNDAVSKRLENEINVIMVTEAKIKALAVDLELDYEKLKDSFIQALIEMRNQGSRKILPLKEMGKFQSNNKNKETENEIPLCTNPINNCYPKSFEKAIDKYTNSCDSSFVEYDDDFDSIEDDSNSNNKNSFVHQLNESVVDKNVSLTDESFICSFYEADGSDNDMCKIDENSILNASIETELDSSFQ